MGTKTDTAFDEAFTAKLAELENGGAATTKVAEAYGLSAEDYAEEAEPAGEETPAKDVEFDALVDKLAAFKMKNMGKAVGKAVGKAGKAISKMGPVRKFKSLPTAGKAGVVAGAAALGAGAAAMAKKRKAEKEDD